MPDRDSSYLSGGGGNSSSVGEEGGPGLGGTGEGRGVSAGGSGSGGMGGGGALGNGSCGGSGAGGLGSGVPPDGVCRDFLRNVCKRGKRCRFKHPDFNEVPDLGVQKNEFIFCHDHQNKECVRSNCRFVHGSKEDEDYYKKSGELPLRLRGKVAAGLGLSPMDLPHSRGEVPICRDFLKGECQRGNKCKFRHVKKDFEFEPSMGVGGVMGPGASGMVNTGGGVGGAGGGACGGMSGLVGSVGGGNMIGMGCPSLGGCRDPVISGVGGVGAVGMGGCLSMGPSGQRRYDRGPCSVYDPLFESGLFETGPLEVPVDHTALQLKRRRLEGLRLSDVSGGGHYELGLQATLQPRHMDYRFLEEENALLRRRVEELKKQVSNLIATNEVLLDQNAQFRSQTKVLTLSSASAPPDQSLVSSVCAVSSYNHSIAQTHTTLSSAGLQPRPVNQQDMGAPTGAPTASQANSVQPTAPPPHLNPEITPLSAALVQTIAQGMAPPVSMAPVTVSVAPVAVSMAQPLAGITMSHATTPMVSYPIASQSMRITTLPH
ncbi:zinc finger CCCH domain-containing protein 10 [Hypomesus transpacificus]|uniref:zinc finger CCCH domain-containing protein 10 n=1 Tax=Hypomesus transpacificus TaxID=137520 RepID=UPI001F0870F1|nr:zinc finger CCCH domain-containing protein 10 [Hypomesus transpacificus]